VLTDDPTGVVRVIGGGVSTALSAPALRPVHLFALVDDHLHHVVGEHEVAAFATLPQNACFEFFGGNRRLGPASHSASRH